MAVRAKFRLVKLYNRGWQALPNVIPVASKKRGANSASHCPLPVISSSLSQHSDRILCNLIERSYCLGVCLEGSLRNNQVRELHRDINVRLL